MENKTKKVLRIRRGEYLLAISTDDVVLTHSIERAIDFSRLSETETEYILSRIYRLGYKWAKIKDVLIDETEENPVKKGLKDFFGIYEGRPSRDD